MFREHGNEVPVPQIYLGNMGNENCSPNVPQIWGPCSRMFPGTCHLEHSRHDDRFEENVEGAHEDEKNDDFGNAEDIDEDDYDDNDEIEEGNVGERLWLHQGP